MARCRRGGSSRGAHAHGGGIGAVEADCERGGSQRELVTCEVEASICVSRLLKLERNVHARACSAADLPLKHRTAARSAMTGMAMADDEWEWPEEKPSASNYYNSGAASFPAPEPKKLAAKVIVEEEDHVGRQAMVRNYSWSDDTNYIRVYVPVPGVVREHVTCDIGEDKIDFPRADAHVRRLHDGAPAAVRPGRRFEILIQGAREEGEGDHLPRQIRAARLRHLLLRHLQAVVQVASRLQRQEHRRDAGGSSRSGCSASRA